MKFKSPVGIPKDGIIYYM